MQSYKSLFVFCPILNTSAINPSANTLREMAVEKLENTFSVGTSRTSEIRLLPKTAWIKSKRRHSCDRGGKSACFGYIYMYMFNTHPLISSTHKQAHTHTSNTQRWIYGAAESGLLIERRPLINSSFNDSLLKTGGRVIVCFSSSPAAAAAGDGVEACKKKKRKKKKWKRVKIYDSGSPTRQNY